MPTLENISNQLPPKKYVESLEDYDLFDLSVEIDQKDYYCRCLVGLESINDDDLTVSVKKLSENIVLLNEKDKKVLTLLSERYI